MTKNTTDKKETKAALNQETLLEEMDFWVKDFEKKIQRTSDMQTTVQENKQNIDYNYELIKELQKELTQMKKDITELRHASVIAMRSRPLKQIE
jgi:peptidoglycan hydrolase CwlO-like protein